MANEDENEASQRVRQVREKDGNRLFLKGLRIDRLPALAFALESLRYLSVEDTDITAVDEISHFDHLSGLSIEGTSVQDLSPLQGHKNLKQLFCTGSLLNDISSLPLIGKVRWLGLSSTYVRDLRPLLSCHEFSSPYSEERAIFFDNTPACEDPAIAGAAEIEDHEERLQALLTHLRTLPPWPEPLPKSGEKKSTPPVPLAAPAPVEVSVANGRLVATNPSTTESRTAATDEAWQALREMLEDLSDLRPNIDNAMPRLAKAMMRVENALGATPAACNAINLGSHGSRVISLAEHAGDTLMDEAASEVKALAAALALHLEHFPEWVAYRQPADTPPGESVRDALDDLRNFHDELRASASVDADIPDVLGPLIDAVEDDPTQPLSIRAVIDSGRNIAIGILGWIRTEAKDVAGQSWTATKTLIAGGIGAATTTGLLALLESTTGALTQLSIKLPGAFGWVKPLLDFFGL